MAYKGSDSFYSCPTGDHGGWNIYSEPVKGQDKCMPISLKADACFHGCASSTKSCKPTPKHKSTSMPTSTSTSTSTTYTTTTRTTTTTKCSPSTVSPQTVTSTSCSTMTLSTPIPAPPMSSSSSSTVAPAPMATCPADLIGSNFEFPHLIVHMDQQQQDKVLGNSLNGIAAGSISSIFNFDIPVADVGKTCSLKFLLPAEGTMETSSYKLSGNGSVEFAILESPATKDTTYATAPLVHNYLSGFDLVPGNAYNVSSYPCPAGQTVSFWMYATGNTRLGYFQDFNPCPCTLTDVIRAFDNLAVRAVFNTYELVEQIMLHLPRVYIYRAAQISKTCHTVRTESPALAKLIAPVKPLTAADIKPFTPTELTQFGAPGGAPGFDSFFTQPDFDIPTSLDRIAELYAAGKAIRPMDTIPYQTKRLSVRPHYASSGEHGAISVHPGLTPSYGRPNPYGTLVTLHIPMLMIENPATNAWVCPPGEYATDPPVTEARIGVFWRGRTVGSTMACCSGGLTLRKSVRAQMDIFVDGGVINALAPLGFWGELECVVEITMGVDAGRLRSGVSGNWSVRRESGIDTGH
ncbi:hypothetical protein B0A55_11942 [Friedmanniomyces simplex]|uniref:Ubiquitin 3 binding protein But2 C-terminal domain-containing protein n=1 Tax=Friedmanniomyces simplex TaxID=329884 RepID=A0A4U0VSR9_9PEZI|nr:hypothetical protein B0A55_11942 [Friedmanniomyces simplex]